MNKLNCNVIRDLIPAYVDDICSADTKGIVEEHLQECPGCRNLVEMIRETELVSEEMETKEIHYMKKVKKHLTVKTMLCIGLLLVIAGVGVVLSVQNYGMVPLPFYYCLAPVWMMVSYLLLSDYINTAKDTTKDTAKDMTKDTTKDMTKDTTKNTIKNTTRDTTKDTTRDITKDTTRDTTKNTTRNATKNTRWKGIITGISTAILLCTFLLVIWMGLQLGDSEGLFGMQPERMGPVLNGLLILFASLQLLGFILTCMCSLKTSNSHMIPMNITIAGCCFALSCISLLHELSVIEHFIQIWKLTFLIFLAEGVVLSFVLALMNRKMPGLE